MFRTEYFFSEKFYTLIGALGGVTVLYILLRVLLPRIAAAAAGRFGTEGGLVLTFNRYVRRALALAYLIFVLNLLAAIPLTARYAEPVLKYPILDVQTLRLSLASLVKGIIGFYFLLVLTKILRTAIRMYLSYRSHGQDVVSTVDILVYNAALVIITIMSLSIVGISWQILLPLAGALGIGIGFGFRDIANNFVSGFVILTSRTVKRGDWITLGSNFGRIVDFGIRTSTIRTVDNIDVIIPNSHMISNELINWSYTDNIVRIHIPVGVAYSSDVPKVRETLLEVARKSDHVLDGPLPEARFLEFGESSLNFELLVWVDISTIKIPLIKSSLNYAIWGAFKEKGIEVPFPQRDIWFKNGLRIEKE